MSKQYHPTYFFPLALFFFFCTLTYSGSVFHAWHLDDSANILHNTTLHITDLHPSTLLKTFYAYPGNTGTFFRPVTNLSFALNWFVTQDQPFGYHLINICIHYLTATVLFFSCILLLRTPTLKLSNSRQQQSTAVLTAILWIAAPIHTQPVTYIVQRMAQLATLFSITAILFFLLARLVTHRGKQLTFFLLTLTCALLAFGSKENSVILPLSILLIECIFFSKISSFFAKFIYNKKKALFISITLLLGTSILFFIYTNSIFDYEHRSFTMTERLLTEPRILLFYLSQIFFPSPSSLSIEHDVILSNSLFTPWNTLPALGICIGLILYAFIRAHKYPLLSFAILFFFLNHVIESTVIPLELLFEHRNYLPSLFLFLPVANLITMQLSDTRHKNKWGRIFTFATCAGFLILSGVSTYERNKVWATEQSLWEDAVAKAPKSGRAKLNLAKSYIENQRYDEAFLLCEESEQFVGATENKLKAISLGSKGAIAYNLGNYEETLTLMNRALGLRADYTDINYKKIQLLIELQRYEEALSTTIELYDKTQSPQLLLIKGSLLLRLNNPDESLKTYKRARQFFSNSSLVSAGQGKAMSILRAYKQADTIFSFAMAAKEPDAIFLRIENYLYWGKHDQATRLLQQLLGSVPLQILLDDLSTSPSGAFQIPFNHLMIRKQLLSLLNKPMYTKL
jgi:protein O-mannosyl-transferase